MITVNKDKLENLIESEIGAMIGTPFCETSLCIGTFNDGQHDYEIQVTITRDIDNFLESDENLCVTFE